MRLHASVNGEPLEDRVSRRSANTVFPCRAAECKAQGVWRDGWCWHHHPENRAAVRLDGFAKKEARRKKVEAQIADGIREFIESGGQIEVVPC